jgi:tetratricopeptide (TPR) repeat protein
MKTWIFGAFILWLLIACNSGKEEPKPEAAKDTSAAGVKLSELDQMIAANPDNDSLLHQRALLLIGMKRFEDAHRDMQKAVSIDSTKAPYFLTLSDIYFAGNRIMYARNALIKAAELDPHNLQAHSKLAEVYFLLKKYDESVRHTAQMLNISPGNALAYFIRGMCYKETGDTNRALSAFQTAIENDREYYNAYMQAGILFQLKNNPVCMEYFNNALRIKPESEEALYGRAMFLQENGDYDRAIQDYTQILKINPRNKNAHYNLGYVHYTYLKVYSQAIKHYDDAIAADPNYAEAYYSRGLCYEAVGNIGAAQTDYEKSLQLRPGYELPQLGLKRIAAIPQP